MSLHPFVRRFACIEYPGLTTNVENAVETMGGKENLSKLFCDGFSISLTHRPEDPFARVTSSQLRKCFLSVVVLVKRNKRTKSCKVEILGIVDKCYQFKSLFDLQYLPMKRVSTSENSFNYQPLLPALFPQSFDESITWFEGDAHDVRSDDLLMPPHLFSRFFNATHYLLCRHESKLATENSLDKAAQKIVTDKDVSPVKGIATMVTPGTSTRKMRKSNAISVEKDDEFPSQPNQAAIVDANQRIKDVNCHEKLKVLFEDRPIWTKAAISFKTEISDTILKVLLPKFAFYIASGPYQRCWCKYGYDPRVDADGVQYQVVMVNYGRIKGFKAEDFNLSTPNRLRMINKYQSSGNTSSRTEDPESLYCFEPGTMPPNRQMFYQLKDIRLPLAVRLLNEAKQTLEPKLLSNAELDKIREDIRSTLKNMMEPKQNMF